MFCIGFTRYYQDRHESELFATVITILGLSLVFATLALLPVDIFLVSSTVDNHTGLKKDWANPDMVYWMTLTIQIIYYSEWTLAGMAMVQNVSANNGETHSLLWVNRSVLILRDTIHVFLL